MTDPYVIEQAPLDHLEPVLDMWREHLGGAERVATQLSWLLHEDSAGTPLVVVLRHVASAGLVGNSTVMPRRMLWRGREIRAGILFDLSVAAEHRSLGPALLLANGMVAVAAEHLDLLYSFPTPQAVAVGRRAGHVRLGDLVRYARVLRHARHLSTHVPRLPARVLGAVLDTYRQLLRRLAGWRRGMKMSAQWTNQADLRFDALWRDSEHGAALVRIHDTRMARWRFDASPFVQTRYLLLSDPKSNALLAWFACHERDSVLHVDDAWSTDGVRGASHECVRQLLLAAWSARYHTVSYSFAGPIEAMRGWTGNGFVKRNQRPILGRWTGSADGGPQDLFLTAADEDQ